MAQLPDLRVGESTITYEHCSVILENLRKILFLTEDTDAFNEIVDGVDIHEMSEFFTAEFTPDSFHRLFKSDLGKGALAGMYISFLTAGFNYEEESRGN